jgi:hypothetical protein
MAALSAVAVLLPGGVTALRKVGPVADCVINIAR